MKDAFAEQVRGLIDGGVDVLLIETIIDTLSAKAALLAAAEVDPEGKVPDHPVGDHHRPQRPHAVGPDDRRVLGVGDARASPLAVGINCALGAREMRPYLAELSRVATTFVSSYPNAGLPNAFGQYDQHAPETGELVKDFADQRLRQHRRRLLRDDPDHIRAIAEQVAGVPARKIPDSRRTAVVQVAAHAVCGARSAGRSAPTATSR